MANQTSKVVRKQSTPHSIGRLMDADVSWSILLRCVENPLGAQVQTCQRLAGWADDILLLLS